MFEVVTRDWAVWLAVREQRCGGDRAAAEKARGDFQHYLERNDLAGAEAEIRRLVPAYVEALTLAGHVVARRAHRARAHAEAALAEYCGQRKLDSREFLLMARKESERAAEQSLSAWDERLEEEAGR